LLAADSEPRATSAIPDILGFIGMVLESGHAYQAGGAVYFNVSSWPAFGSLSHYDRAQMLAFARERGGNPDDPNKADPLDFVLWQPSAPDEPAWSSLWGSGRPGWHIECSALALRELGLTIDLHGGGSDLIFPHHECESAQSQAATGEPFVRHWAHTGMVRFEGEKMSKSLGNLVFVRDLLKLWEPATVRLAVVGHHYRSDWDWEDGLLTVAAQRMAAWRAAAEGQVASEGGPVLERARAALDDDLDTVAAIAALDQGAERGEAGMAAGAALLGVHL
jgi:L-cysteine:1D-myo-inositol 2-amino-2-deoxy-alpha-D-glucopyranoside ligase